MVDLGVVGGGGEGSKNFCNWCSFVVMIHVHMYVLLNVVCRKLAMRDLRER